jgi:hypothetical protein
VVKLRGKGFVASYSSATVADSHGVPCADVLRFSPNNVGLNLSKNCAQAKQMKEQLQEDSPGFSVCPATNNDR